jgi:nickel-type superoxide dismutase maturation protease
MFVIRRVAGDSMLPALSAGSVVIGWRSRQVKPGNIVIVRHQGIEKIKRIARIDDDQLYLLGDNANSSTDSRQFGMVSRQTIVARVIWPRT